ncbi:hypothetical protein PVAP13_9KG399501, partial [Panicum virgatum]
DVNGVILFPVGTLMGKKPSPSGEPGAGTFHASPSPFPVGDPSALSSTKIQSPPPPLALILSSKQRRSGRCPSTLRPFGAPLHSPAPRPPCRRCVTLS